MHDAKPQDVYVDGKGRLWRCTWTCPEPSLELVPIEPAHDKPGAMAGGVSGQMWNGFTRIFRPPKLDE